MFWFCQISRLGLGNCDSNITERLKSRAVDQQRKESWICLPTAFNISHVVVLCRSRSNCSGHRREESAHRVAV